MDATNVWSDRETHGEHENNPPLAIRSGSKGTPHGYRNNAFDAWQPVRRSHAGGGTGAGGNPERRRTGNRRCRPRLQGRRDRRRKNSPSRLATRVTRTLRAMIRRRSAIEPAIGHMKADGKLDRNWLKGALGDAINAVLCGAGHNLRMILRKLRFLRPCSCRFARSCHR
jgi:hypothetical protein